MPPGSVPEQQQAQAATPPPFKASDSDDPDAAYMPKGDYQP